MLTTLIVVILALCIAPYAIGGLISILAFLGASVVLVCALLLGLLEYLLEFARYLAYQVTKVFRRR